MIVVKVELWSAVTGKVTELARMHICNDGDTTIKNPRKGSYYRSTFRGRDRFALNRHAIQKTGRVENYPRVSLHVWNLVARMLKAMGYA
jgi:hypothetical protein